MFYISLFLYHKTLRRTGAGIQKTLMEHIKLLRPQGSKPRHQIFPFTISFRMTWIGA